MWNESIVIDQRKLHVKKKSYVDRIIMLSTNLRTVPLFSLPHLAKFHSWINSLMDPINDKRIFVSSAIKYLGNRFRLENAWPLLARKYYVKNASRSPLCPTLHRLSNKSDPRRQRRALLIRPALLPRRVSVRFLTTSCHNFHWRHLFNW